MTMRIVCPACKAALKAAKAPASGAAIKCPKCEKAFRYDPQQQQALAAAPSSVPAAAAPPEPPASRGSRWPVVIALLGLIAVIGGTAYLLRDDLSKLLAKNGEESKKATEADGGNSSGQAAGQSSSQNGGNTTGQQAANPDRTVTQQGRAPRRQSPAKSSLATPAVINTESIPSQMVFSADQTIMACTDLQTIELWNMVKGEKIKTLEYTPGFELQLEFSPDGQVLAALSRNENAWECKLFLLPDAAEIASFQWTETDDDVEAAYTQEAYEAPIAFSANSERFALPGDEHAIVVWDLTRAQELVHLTGQQGRIDDLVFTSRGDKLISTSADTDYPEARIWSLDSGEGRALTTDQHIYECRLTSDDKKLITRSHDRVAVWNLLPTGAARLDHNISDYSARHIYLWPNDDTLLLVSTSSANNGEFVLWDLATQKMVKRIQPSITNNDVITAVVPSPDGRTLGAISSFDGLTLFDAPTGQVRVRYPHVADGSEYISSYQFDYTGGAVVIAMSNNRLRVVPMTGGGAIVSSALATLTPPSQPLDVKISDDSRTVTAVLRPKPIDTSDPAIVSLLDETHTQFQAESRKWAGASEKQRQDLETEFYLEHFPPKLRPIAERQQWANVAAIWDIRSPEKPQRLLPQPLLEEADIRELLSSAQRIPFTKDPRQGALLISPLQGAVATGKQYLFCELGRNEVVWINRLRGFQLTDLQSKQDITVADAPRRLESWRLSPQGNALAAVISGSGASDYGRLVLIDLEQGREKLSLPFTSHQRPSQTEYCFSPDGVSFAAIIRDDSNVDEPYSLKLWDTATGREPNPPLKVRLSGFPTAPDNLVISPDGTFVAYPSADGPRLIDLITGRLRQTSVTNAALLPTFSPDSQFLVFIQEVMTGLPRNDVRFLDLASGQMAKQISGFTTSVQSMAFSPDGQLLALGGGELNDMQNNTRLSEPYAEVASELKLFDAESGDLLAILGGHQNLVTQVTFSADGELLASLSWDGTIKIWKVADVLNAGGPTAVSRARPPLAKIRRPAVTAPAADSNEEVE